jgi:hypothetical protein
MRSSTIQRHRRPRVSMNEDRTSLDVGDGDHAIARPAFDFAFFVKDRVSIVPMWS